MYYSEEDLSDAVIFAKANVNSIVMPNFKMAEALLNEEYFNAAKHPYAEFQSKKLTALATDSFKISGLIKK